jgi:prepilin-type N-terminal cleavage/methylation domain-containing protein
MRNKAKGFTLIEVSVVSFLLLIVFIPVLTIYVNSIAHLYTVDKMVESQKQGQNALYFIAQDMNSSQGFISISSTSCFASTYRFVNVGYYLNSTDSTLRRVNTNSFTGGEIKARNITKLNFTYYFDNTFQPTYIASTVCGLRCDIVVNVPASDLTNPNAVDTAGFAISSYIWCRNLQTFNPSTT